MAQGSSKKARKGTASRPRGSEIKTGNRGAKRTKLTTLQKALMGGGVIKALNHHRDEANRRYRAKVKAARN